MQLKGKITGISVVLVLLIIFGAAIYWKKNQPVTIVVFAAKRGDLITQVSASGSVEAETRAKLSGKIGGKITAIMVKEGAIVKSGQMLIQLDDAELRAQLQQANAAFQGAEANFALIKRGARSEEIASAAAQLASAQANLEEIKKNYQRMEQLQKDGAVSAQQLDAAKAQYEVALAQVKTADEQLQLIKSRSTKEDIAAADAKVKEIQANIQQLQAELANTRIYAPFSGTVTQKLVETGETIVPGAPLLILADMDTIQITCNVDETDVGKVRVGMPAKVYLDSYPGQTFSGIVNRISPQTADIKEKGVTFAAKIKVTSIDVPLRIGMSTDVDIQVENQHDVLYVPVESVAHEGDTHFVYVIEKNVARKRLVQVGTGNDEYMVILSGIKENERVARTELDKLHDGSRVRITP